MRSVILIVVLLFTTAFSYAGGGNVLRVVEGKVIDDSGNPAVGAKVVLTGSNDEVYTDFDGVFKFENINTSIEQKLKISYIAHQEVELKINSDDKENLNKIEFYLESK